MRISFDLDDTLICYGGATPCEPRLPMLLRLLIRDEPLRLGTRELVAELRRRGHKIWIYTSSSRSRRWIRWWFRCHGVRIDSVINGPKHAACFGGRSTPTKRPHAFGIDLHIDDSEGVATEGQRHGFNVCVVHPTETNWVNDVLGRVSRPEAA